eukprot:SAG11_NODE_6084_length_1391_cov_1.527864_1_plen_114_part_00
MPGHSPVFDPCGMAGGGPTKEGGEAKYITTKYAKQGDLGSKVLPYSPTGIQWRRGGLGTTKWSIRSNHGGAAPHKTEPLLHPTHTQPPRARPDVAPAPCQVAISSDSASAASR